MALIDLDKFVASFITEIKKNHMVITYNIHSCIKKALEDQGLEYKGGEIVKSQRRVSAEAKENGYGESEDEEIVKLADEYCNKVLLKECDMEENEAHHCRIAYIHGAKAMLEKQGKERKITHEEICKSYGIPDIGEFSDGYHTFNGLYKQRMLLFAVLVKTYKDSAWKSWKHEDGLDCFGGGWFIVGIDTPAGTYTYHYEAKDWDRFDCQILEKAKHWDGHDEFDVERLFSLVSNAKKVPIWKHWKDGIAGNGEGKPIYLTKVGNTYSLNSCLGFECDYIELSELDNLMLEKQGEKESAWSEEDEEYNGEDYGIDSLYHAQRILEKTLGKVDGYQTDDGILSHKCAITAIKKLYEHKPIEWKQENREELTEFENAMMHIGGSFFGENAGLDPNDTDTIKEQAELLLELAPKTEWSEEDEKMCQNILECLKNGWRKLPADILKYESWLKSRITWKPSDEQMVTLEYYMHTLVCNSYKETLFSLYQDLKKLRGE